MRKPEQQWETRAHRAIRVARDLDAATDSRAERFVLEFATGETGWAQLDLDEQYVDARAGEDPSLIHAISCWLVARGARTIALRDEHGRSLAVGPINPHALGSSPSTRGANRIVSLTPSNLECIEGLGCLERVIACEDSSDVPVGVDVERLGPDLGPDLDRCSALAPDLVVASLTVPGMERVVTGLRARGLPFVVLAPRSIDDMIDDLAHLGTVLGVEDRAEALARTLRSERASLERDAAAIDPPARVYLEWWPRPMFTPGRSCYSNELIRLAGGANVFGDRPASSLEITTADLLAAEPEVCFVSWCGVAANKLDPANLIARAGLDTLAAARRGHVYPLDERFAGRPGPRMLAAARIMAAGIRRARALQ